MTGYMTLIAECPFCARVFGSNPNTVPSYQNQPICRECVTRINRERIRAGLPPAPVADDAYEPVEA